MAEGESSATASKHSPETAPEHLPVSILATAKKLAVHKHRSYTTGRRHLKDTVEKRGHEVMVGLLGDSMIERMGSTGQWESLQSWPSETMASDSAIQALNDARDDTDAGPIARIQGVANFGCGGDQIQNILYRVVGDPGLTLKGLAQELQPSRAGSLTTRRNLKLWVIQAGTNNLTKHGLKVTDLHALEILLRTLHHLSRPGTKFLVTGLFYRTDIPNGLVDNANEDLQSLVARLEQEFHDPTEKSQGGKERSPTSHNRDDSGISGLPSDNGIFSFLPAPQIDEFSEWLEDKVHLHEEGYQKWMQTLLPKGDQGQGDPRSAGTSELGRSIETLKEQHNVPSPTTIKTNPMDKRPTISSLFDEWARDPNPPWSKKQAKSKPLGGIKEVKEQENTTTESSPGEPGAGPVDQGTAHANEQQASPPPQANNTSFRGRLRARARRICNKVKRLGESIKEKMTKSAVQHH